MSTVFNLRKPCKNCPFKKGTDMELRPGRMEGIVESLKDDHAVFHCHKTLDQEDKSACMGALAYMHEHHGLLPVLARVAISRKTLSLKLIANNVEYLEEPGKWPTN